MNENKIIKMMDDIVSMLEKQRKLETKLNKVGIEICSHLSEVQIYKGIMIMADAIGVPITRKMFEARLSDYGLMEELSFEYREIKFFEVEPLNITIPVPVSEVEVFEVKGNEE